MVDVGLGEHAVECLFGIRVLVPASSFPIHSGCCRCPILAPILPQPVPPSLVVSLRMAEVERGTREKGGACTAGLTSPHGLRRDLLRRPWKMAYSPTATPNTPHRRSRFPTCPHSTSTAQTRCRVSLRRVLINARRAPCPTYRSALHGVWARTATRWAG
jgi:hypothetical protein